MISVEKKNVTHAIKAREETHLQITQDQFCVLTQHTTPLNPLSLLYSLAWVQLDRQNRGQVYINEHKDSRNGDCALVQQYRQ